LRHEIFLDEIRNLIGGGRLEINQKKILSGIDSASEILSTGTNIVRLGKFEIYLIDLEETMTAN